MARVEFFALSRHLMYFGSSRIPTSNFILSIGDFHLRALANGLRITLTAERGCLAFIFRRGFREVEYG